jgi:hypothetical protein
VAFNRLSSLARGVAGRRTFARDESGSVIVYFTVIIVALFAILGLSVGAGRLMILHTELQDFADAAADPHFAKDSDTYSGVPGDTLTGDLNAGSRGRAGRRFENDRSVHLLCWQPEHRKVQSS